MNVEQARFNMIEQQIRPWEVLDGSVLSLLSVIRREDFVPQAQQALAFMDLEIPLGQGRALLAPRVEARMVQDLQLSKRDTVLQIGAATGFVTALLAHKAQRVIALEADPVLAAQARANLRTAAVNNAEVVEGDGHAGLPAQGPFDAILLNGSVADVPAVLFEQLRDGGRLLAIVGHEPMMRATLFTRVGAGQIRREERFDTLAPRLPGFAEPSRFTF
ncbi:methyltransferase domain-containing protein [Aquabacterium fontiphilum]|jgi:protein-L-isoaspartate(D-aspartate) O-methyltransferase|uniref:protein-L-isoaspartate O-methyltransferase family protein n=1 Tax=Aquabacterium fontiphilum TaxID=450365 RepID=UPI00137785F6|nr:protein-L-isoaspartate O-methyltransferase [Aquabacterium fontiphilum]NBD20134.1 methyltransferase domain-containing protein [Aquabacterium fontiphilum]